MTRNHGRTTNGSRATYNMTTLWQIDIYPAAGQTDVVGRGVASDAADLGLGKGFTVLAGRGFLVQGNLTTPQIKRLARELFADPIVEQTVVAPVGNLVLCRPPALLDQQPERTKLIHVLPKPGVMDPVAQSALNATADFGFDVTAVRTLRKYWIA